MAKKRSEMLAENVEVLRPYVERALKDDNVRQNLRDAVAAAQQVYGDLTKGNGSVTKSASKLAVDKNTQEHLRKAFEQLAEASERVKGKKKSHKVRNTMLLAGVVAGALYNPWTGPQTRKWVTDKIAGDDDLQPLESWESTMESAGATAESAADAAESAAERVKDES
jgi:hypothetical protein